MLNETQVSRLGEIKPAIIALCSGPVREQVDLRTLFSQHLLRAAVVSRRPVLARAANLRTDRDCVRSRIRCYNRGECYGFADLRQSLIATRSTNPKPMAPRERLDLQLQIYS